MSQLVFWEPIVNPHLAPLARVLASRGHDVTYVAERESYHNFRSALGIRTPSLAPARLILAPDASAMSDALAQTAPESIHIVAGLRANGPLDAVRSRLASSDRRYWVHCEMVDDAGPEGIIKRLAYGRLCRRFRRRGEGLLAIGRTTGRWFAERGIPAERIVPFIYFLSRPEIDLPGARGPERPFNIVFAGQLIKRKRVDELIEALAGIPESCGTPKLSIIGDGPEITDLRELAERRLSGRVTWHGAVPLEHVQVLLAAADCLVLPSRYDGWGAVVAEALMVGTPAICSDGCGASDIVAASRAGGVYPAGDVAALSALLEDAVRQGPLGPQDRAKLARWAEALCAEQGADYLLGVLEASASGLPKPAPPWINAPLAASAPLRTD